jgi:hypothetical protein
LHPERALNDWPLIFSKAFSFEWELAQHPPAGGQVAKTSKGPIPPSFWISTAKKCNYLLKMKLHIAYFVFEMIFYINTYD